MAAITSTVTIYPVTVPLHKGEGGLRQASMVTLAQMLTIDKSRLRHRLGTLPTERLAAVDEAIRVSLDVG